MSNARMNALGQPIGVDLSGWVPPPFPPHTPLSGRICRLEPRPRARRHCGRPSAGTPKAVTGPTSPRGRSRAPKTSRPGWRNRRRAAIRSSIRSSSRHLRLLLSLRKLSPWPRPVSPPICESHHPQAPSKSATFTSRRSCSTPAATGRCTLMMRRAFELGYRRCEWKCDALNAVAPRCPAPGLLL